MSFKGSRRLLIKFDMLRPIIKYLFMQLLHLTRDESRYFWEFRKIVVWDLTTVVANPNEIAPDWINGSQIL